MDYLAQVHGSLIVTGRKWWDFMSYAPGLEPLRIRVVPDKYTQELAEELEKFWKRFQLAKAKLMKKPAPTAPTEPVPAVVTFSQEERRIALSGMASPILTSCSVEVFVRSTCVISISRTWMRPRTSAARSPSSASTRLWILLLPRAGFFLRKWWAKSIIA